MIHTKNREDGLPAALGAVFLILYWLSTHGPAPGPDPTPPPTPGTLAAAVRTLYKQHVKGRTAADEAAALAGNYRALATEIETLLDPLATSDLIRPQDAVNRAAADNATILGPRRPAWDRFFEGLAQELSTRERTGEIERSIYSVGEAFAHIAEGLTLTRDLTRSDATHQIRLCAHTTEKRVESDYLNGYVGAYIDAPSMPQHIRAEARKGDAAFAAQAGDQTYTSAAFPSTWRGSGAGKRAVYWNYALRFDRDPTPLFAINQITGNCVAASIGDVGFTHLQGVAIFLLRKPFAWRAGGSTAFYMFRGHGGAGMSLGIAAAAHQRYGFPVRDTYCEGRYDLRDANADQRFGMEHWRQQPADFLSATSQQPIGQVAVFRGDSSEAMDILYAGGFLNTGSTTTAAKNGDPISGPAPVGAHAQTCVGYDDTAEFRAWYQDRTGKRLTEPVLMFDQTWGNTQYVRSNWPAHLWGKPTPGMFVLRWSDATRLIKSTCYAYWPDLTGFTPQELEWRFSNARQAHQQQTRMGDPDRTGTQYAGRLSTAANRRPTPAVGI